MGVNRLDPMMNDARRNLRVQENQRVRWEVCGGKDRGWARVRNISLSGMLLEGQTDLPPGEEFLTFRSVRTPGNGYLPQHGRVVWRRQTGLLRKRRLYGIEFVDVEDSVFDRLRMRVQEGIRRLTRRRQWTIFGSGLFTMGVVALLGYGVWTGWRVYQNIQRSTVKMITVSDHQAALTRITNARHKEVEKALTAKATRLKNELTTVRQELTKTQQLYRDSQLMLKDVAQDLDEARSALQQTTRLLAEAKNSNIQLTKEMAVLRERNTRQMEEMREELNATIRRLREKNTRLVEEMASLQGQLDYYNGHVKDMDEGRELMKLYKSRMKLVKARIRYFKKEVRKARKAALKERDRVQSMLGNNGFLTKDGKVVKVDEQKYRAAALSQPSPAGASTALKRPLKIDVKVFK